MVQLRRWKLMNHILIVSFLLIILFAWFDSENIIGIKEIDKQWQEAGGWDPDKNVWTIFWDQISPAVFNLWIGVLAAIGIIWFLISKDKSEAWGLFLTGATLIWFGTQDLIYYIISPDVLTESVGCWANILLPVRVVSDVLGETCPTATSFVLSGLLGIVVAYYIYKYFQKAKW